MATAPLSPERLAELRRLHTGLRPDGYADMATVGELLWLLDEVDRLRAALAPFAAVGRGIPPNWPAECPLVFDQMESGRGRLLYLKADADTPAPPISAYRAAAEALGGGR